MNQAYGLIGPLWNIHIYYTPKSQLQSFVPSKMTDLCGVVKEKLKKFPEFYAGTKTPCRRYFCSETKPKYFSDVQPTSFDIVPMMNTSSVVHTLLQQYCTKCEDTVEERFDEYLAKNASGCPWANTDYCTNTTCSSGSECIFFFPKMNLCYSHDLQEFTGSNGGEYVVNWAKFRQSGYRYIAFALGLILVFSNVFALLIPEVIHFFRNLKSFREKTLYKKIGALLSIRNQLIVWNLILSVGFVISGILDMINVTTFNFHSFWSLLAIVVNVYCWSLIIIKWIDVINKSSNLEFDEPMSIYLQISYGIVTLITVVLGSFCGAMHITYVNNITNSTGEWASKVLMAFILLIIAFLLVVTTVLFITGGVLLQKMRHSGIDDDTFKYKFKFTRNMLLLGASILPVLFILILYSLTLQWGDIISNPGRLLTLLLIIVSSCVLTLISGFFLIDFDKILDPFRVYFKVQEKEIN